MTNEKITFNPPVLKGREFDLLRTNPDRGWRLETYLTLGSNTVMFKPGKAPTEFLDSEIKLYADYPVKLVQFYVYLFEYRNKPLDEAAFSQLEAYLTALKERGLRAVLRFAYEYDATMRKGPRSSMIYRHLDQLKEWFKKNDTLVSQAVMVLQAGIIGVWGEWHTSAFPHSRKKVLKLLTDAAPDYMPLQVRRQKFKNIVLDKIPTDNIGYHDDFLVGEYHIWSTPEGGPGTAAYDNFKEESRLTLNDGEMPWGRDKSHKDGFIDGCEMLTACAERSLTTLSIVHNFIEEEGQYNALRWQEEYITAERAKELLCPFAAEYFKDEEGTDTERSVFDFMTDHLGYQIAVREISITTEGSKSTVAIKLTNGGFALPHGFTQMELVIKKKNGESVIFPFADYEPEELLGGDSGQFHAIAEVEAVAEAESLGIALKKPRVTPLYIRFANKCQFEDGVNFFKITPVGEA